MRWTEHTARKREWRKPIRWSRHRREDHIKVDLKEGVW